MKPGDEIELTVERDGDAAVAFDGKRRVNVDGAIPGERVRARIGRRTKKGFEARLVEAIDSSPDRVAPRCRYFGTCGGCDWQHLAYEAQLRWKRSILVDAIGTSDVRPVIPGERQYDYRNKMEFSFGSARWLTDEEVASAEGAEGMDRGFALGFFVPGRFDRILDLHECWLQSRRSAALVNRVREVARAHGLPPWNTRTFTGFLRHLVIRQPGRGLHGDEWMVNLVTSPHDGERLAPFAAMLRAEFPEVATFVNTINRGVAQIAIGAETNVVFGAGVVHDHIGDLVFEIGPQSFFQTNTAQAERLYSEAAALAELQRSDLVFDLFCGVGAIALSVARRVAKVVGIEIQEGAVENARRNAAANGIDNAVFESGDLRTALASCVARHGTPDVVILDPPRAGVHPDALRAIRELRPPRLVYVSCNPKTLASDVRLLLRDYRVEVIQPIDMFPQTTHVECVVSLRAT